MNSMFRFVLMQVAVLLLFLSPALSAQESVFDKRCPTKSLPDTVWVKGEPVSPPKAFCQDGFYFLYIQDAEGKYTHRIEDVRIRYKDQLVPAFWNVDFMDSREHAAAARDSVAQFHARVDAAERARQDTLAARAARRERIDLANARAKAAANAQARKDRINGMPWPASFKQLVIDRRVAIGMTADMVQIAWGKPEHVNTSHFATHDDEQWVYGSGNYVYLRNGVVESVQTSR